MAEALVSALASTILGNLNSLVLEELGVVGGLKTELQNLKRTFTTVQAVLQDAEEKQWKSEAIKNWLRNLKDAAYDADDVLDEFAIEAQRRRQRRDFNNRVRSCFSLDHNPLVFRVKMAHKLKRLRERFEAISRERRSFHLMERDGETELYSSADWRLTCSVVNESEIYGRHKEKEELINLLLPRSDDLSVHAICGMGGLGKTTLAQLVYNDARVKDYFDLRIWVYVSNDFDMRRLARAIIESIERSPETIQELDPLQRCLQEKLSGRRFLLMLDDVWDHYHEKWNGLKDILRVGARGSAIMLTTRIQQVAQKMATIRVQHVGPLSDDDSWLLFERIAFRLGRREEYVHLETIGKAIVNKCGGVPLAIKALGSLMRVKRDEQEWLSVKESEIWNLGDEGSSILPALRLSYINLPPHLKQCFAFCCIFPKDFVMKKDQLVELWLANGFIPCKGQMDLHDMGHEIFNELVGRSIFQDVKEDGLGNTTCKMHYLIHDLAQSVMLQECCLIKDSRRQEIPKMVRHVGFFERYGAHFDLLKVQSLRSLLSVPVYGYPRLWSDAFSLFLSGQKHLRALNLSSFMFHKLPDSIANLKHLRCLDVSNSYIQTLPESICTFQNLQTLNLRNCQELYMLPNGMKEMKSLLYLDIKGCHSLICMPPGMGHLAHLRKLSIFIVGEEDGRHIRELQNLNLGGELSIKDLDNVENTTDAKSSNLMRKTNLQSLSLSWGKRNSVSKENSEKVLSALQPHSNLKRLRIHKYGGSNFPGWMMDLLLPNLVEISLELCHSCEHLPPFGKLLFLKYIELYGMDGVKCIGNDMYGGGTNPFPSLERLSFGPMRSLEEWETMDGREVFPRLHELSVQKCPKLVKLPIIPSIKKLKIEDCSVTLMSSIMNFTALTSLRIGAFDELTHLPDGLLQNHILLESLDIYWMRSLKSLSNQLDNLSSLKRLKLWDCDELESLPEGLQNLNSLEKLSITSLPITGLCALPSLETLLIRNCAKLTSISEGLQKVKGLKDLLLSGCPKLNSLPESVRHLASLQSLSICYCKGLSCLPNEIGYLTSLSLLVIEDCPKLLSFPEGIQSLNMLRELNISSCPDLETRCKKERGEDWTKIAHIPTIIINNQLVNSLES